MDKMRYFLWIGINADGIQETGGLKGVSLLEALITEYKSTGSCMYWENGCCEDWDNLSIEDKAKKILWYIEESHVGGDSSNQISVIDITNPENTITLFPIEERSNNFDVSIIGIKYEIRAWIPAECEDPQTYDSMESAMDELNQLQLMQPENRYEIHEIKEDSNE